MNPKIFWVISIAVFFSDQISKLIVDKLFFQPVNLWFFSIAKTRNTGIAWGFLQGSNSILILISIIIIVLIIYYRSQFIKNNLSLVSSALILGGALGNLADRIFYGSVLDFIDFYFWPVFNVADSAITIGGAMLALWLWRE